MHFGILVPGGRAGSCDEVGGQPLVTKGIQPPPPEPDGHVCVHPALRFRVLRVKAVSPLRATSTFVEPSTCPPSSCPRHYPRRLATMGTLSPWALLPLADPVVVCLVRSTLRASVHPLPLLLAGWVLPEDHGGDAHPPVRQESGFQRLSRRCRNAPPGTGVQAIQPYPCVASLANVYRPLTLGLTSLPP